MESEEMKAARHIVWGQFMNQLIFRMWNNHRLIKYQQVREQSQEPFADYYKQQYQKKHKRKTNTI